MTTEKVETIFLSIAAKMQLKLLSQHDRDLWNASCTLIARLENHDCEKFFAKLIKLYGFQSRNWIYWVNWLLRGIANKREEKPSTNQKQKFGIKFGNCALSESDLRATLSVLSWLCSRQFKVWFIHGSQKITVTNKIDVINFSHEGWTTAHKKTFERFPDCDLSFISFFPINCRRFNC